MGLDLRHYEADLRNLGQPETLGVRPDELWVDMIYCEADLRECRQICAVLKFKSRSCSVFDPTVFSQVCLQVFQIDPHFSGLPRSVSDPPHFLSCASQSLRSASQCLRSTTLS